MEFTASVSLPRLAELKCKRQAIMPLVCLNALGTGTERSDWRRSIFDAVPTYSATSLTYSATTERIASRALFQGFQCEARSSCRMCSLTVLGWIGSGSAQKILSWTFVAFFSFP